MTDYQTTLLLSILLIVTHINTTLYNMIYQINEAAAFLTQVLVSFSEPEVAESRNALHRCLVQLLTDKITGHWYPNDPQRGHAFRSICMEKTTQVLDPLLVKALDMTGLKCPSYNWPEDMTIWIDPDQVMYTILPLGQHPRNRVWCEIYSNRPSLFVKNANKQGSKRHQRLKRCAAKKSWKSNNYLRGSRLEILAPVRMNSLVW